MFRVRIFGVREAQTKLRATVGAANRAVDRALLGESERIMRLSKKSFVPVREGALRASGRVVATGAAPLASVVLGYGGSARAYAVVQHENPRFHHTVGQWHYLITPVLMSVPELRRVIRESVRAVLYRGGVG